MNTPTESRPVDNVLIKTTPGMIIRPAIAGVLTLAALLFPLKNIIPPEEPLTLSKTLQQSYQQCQTIEDKDRREELPLGEYTCREVEDLYFKVKY